MTPTRSGSNYSIQSNGSGTGNSSHKSKRQECQPRGEAQMEERVGTSPKSLDRHHELISSGEEVHGARKDRGTSEGLDTHVLQRTSPKDKRLVEKPKHHQGKSCVNHWQLTSHQANVKQDKIRAHVKQKSSKLQAHVTLLSYTKSCYIHQYWFHCAFNSDSSPPDHPATVRWLVKITQDRPVCTHT
ncbi:hypothetical protein O181_127140, partial [Austropuccinia psidii MF-1]|nr:hypothetical protein [Austropuccinia psidii MF-1]